MELRFDCKTTFLLFWQRIQSSASSNFHRFLLKDNFTYLWAYLYGLYSYQRDIKRTYSNACDYKRYCSLHVDSPLSQNMYMQIQRHE